MRLISEIVDQVAVRIRARLSRAMINYDWPTGFTMYLLKRYFLDHLIIMNWNHAHKSWLVSLLFHG